MNLFCDYMIKCRYTICEPRETIGYFISAKSAELGICRVNVSSKMFIHNFLEQIRSCVTATLSLLKTVLLDSHDRR